MQATNRADVVLSLEQFRLGDVGYSFFFFHLEIKVNISQLGSVALQCPSVIKPL